MGDLLVRLRELADRSWGADDRAWFLSPAGLLAACREIAQLRDEAMLDCLDGEDVWSNLHDCSPYESGAATVRRGKAIVLACHSSIRLSERDQVQDVEVAALAMEAGASPAIEVARDLVHWMSRGRGAPEVLRRTTFLVDEHAQGGAMRLTFARYPGGTSFGPDFVANPFTIVDGRFHNALAEARVASANPLEGIRWSVTSEIGDAPLELEGDSVGLAALACFEQLQLGTPLGAETSWAFTGVVDSTGVVIGIGADGGERAFTNKLRAADRRTVVVANDDLGLATRVVDAAGLSVRLRAVGDRASLCALLATRKPVWLGNEAIPIAGREAELSVLADVADDVGATGRARVCFLEGEAGIGKTRLAREFAARRRAIGWNVGWGTCFAAEATVAFRPAVAAIRSLLAALDDPGEIAAVGRSDLAVLIPELGTLPSSARPPRLGPARQMAVFDAVARMLQALAERQPVVIVLDDLHWSDRSSLRLVSHVARHCVDVPVMLVVAYRPHEIGPEHVAADWLADLRAGDAVETLRLGGLDHPGTEAMLAGLHGRSTPAAFAASMFAVTGGNPLFVHELDRDARASGAVDARRNAWQVQAAGARLPSGLRTVLARRLRVLSADGVEACRCIASTSAGVSFDVLCAATGVEHLALLDALDQAVAAGVIIEQERDAVGLVYDLSHPLFRQALTETLTKARQEGYHHALGTALASLPDPFDRWIGDVAYHLHAARTRADPEVTMRACVRAGTVATARTAYDDAATHFGRAIAAAGLLRSASDSTLASLELHQAEAMHRAGDRRGRLDGARRAFDRAEVAGDPETMARAALVHGGARSTYGLPSTVTMGLLTRADECLGSTDGDASLRAQVKSRLAQETYHVQRFDEAKALSADALALMPRSGACADRAAVLDGRAWTLHTPDDLQARALLADEMIGEAVGAGDPEWEMMGRIWRCTCLLETGDVVGIDIELAHLDSLGEVAPVPSHLFRVATLRCTRAMMRGEFDVGTELANRAYEMGTGIEPENATQTLCAQMLGMFREQGLLGGLVDVAEQMVAEFPMVAGWRAALAFVNLEAGRGERARTLFDGLAAGNFANVPRDLAWLQAQSYLTEVATAFEDRRAAAILYRDLAPFAGRNVGLFDIASNGAVDHYLGVLAAVCDRRAVAVRHLRSAVQFNDATCQVPHASRSRLALGRLLREGPTGQRAEADRLFAVADRAATAGGLVRLSEELALV